MNLSIQESESNIPIKLSEIEMKTKLILIKTIYYC